MINYSDLYELLRKEKYSETLQFLPKNFVSELSDYLKGLREESSKEDGLLVGESVKMKKQLENSIAIFKELILRRKKKLLNLAFVATETGIMKRDYENMLSFEKEAFESLVKIFEDGDKKLFAILKGDTGKDKEEKKYKMIVFNQNVEQFVGMNGETFGPFKNGELTNVAKEVAEIFVSGGKASFVDEE